MTIKEIIDILSQVEDQNSPVFCTDAEMYHTEELIELNVIKHSTNSNLNNKVVFVRDA